MIFLFKQHIRLPVYWSPRDIREIEVLLLYILISVAREFKQRHCQVSSIFIFQNWLLHAESTGLKVQVIMGDTQGARDWASATLKSPKHWFTSIKNHQPFSSAATMICKLHPNRVSLIQPMQKDGSPCEFEFKGSFEAVYSKRRTVENRRVGPMNQ